MNKWVTLGSLTEEMNAQLDELAVSNHCGAGLLTLGGPSTQLRFRLQGVERLACEVESMRLVSGRMEGLEPKNPGCIAEAIADRVNYLDEPLIVLERDGHQVLMRSQKPTVVDGGERHYFELLLEPETISFVRYQKRPASRRTTIPMVFTRPQLSRLAFDLLTPWFNPK